MVNVIGIRFQTGGKLYFFDPGETRPSISDKVLVETSRGFELGEVIMPVREVSESSVVAPLKTVIRIATEEDLKHEQENKEKEKEAFRICQEKIAANNLEMKLVRAEIGFDNNKILFYFTANGRVDFRALVKDLAAVFKTRIELRQIGVRDEARMIGGLGPCGRPICCDAFLADFEPVSIKMAKEQKLSLNPTKISGVCGRLMCCLKYEEEQYEGIRKRMPKVGKEFSTPDGTATVIEQNILKECVVCRVFHGDTNEIKEYTLNELTELGIAKPYVQEDLSKEQANAKPNDSKDNTDLELQKDDEKEIKDPEENAVLESSEKTPISRCDLCPKKAMQRANWAVTQNEAKEEIESEVVAETPENKKPVETKEKAPEKQSEVSQQPNRPRADVWRAALEKAMEAANSRN